MIYRNHIKRTLDIVLSLAGLAALWWLFPLIAAAIRLDSPGPVIFRQKRVGREGRFFYILKFRTMGTDAPEAVATHLLPDPGRYVTRVGRFLRRTSLDELPQLVNILRGDMTLVGPRPALWNQTDLLALREQNGSAALRPGLTGWAQIHGRDTLTTAEKARLDGAYAQNLCFSLDLYCLAATIPAVLLGSGIPGEGPIAWKKPRC